jgi:hypothetical protein
MSLLIEHRSPTTTASSRRPGAWRELASRHTGGITVDLYWQPEGDEIFVEVSDELTGENFVLEAPKDSALAAFYHPYALRPPADEA